MWIQSGVMALYDKQRTARKMIDSIGIDISKTKPDRHRNTHRPFLPDMTAKNQDMRARGKPRKVALTALIRKLPERANALIKRGRKRPPKLA